MWTLAARDLHPNTCVHPHPSLFYYGFGETKKDRLRFDLGLQIEVQPLFDKPSDVVYGDSVGDDSPMHVLRHDGGFRTTTEDYKLRLMRSRMTHSRESKNDHKRVWSL
jgi:hypothetical protein